MLKGFNKKSCLPMDNRTLSVIVFSLFFSWMLAFPFEGQILYALAKQYDIKIHLLIFSCIAAHFFGLFGCGFIIKSMMAAKRLMIISIIFCMVASSIFFFPPSFLWYFFLITASVLAGGCVAAWGFYFKSSTLSNERIKTAADGLIYSNILMIILNAVAINLYPQVGLGLSILMLAGALIFATRLQEDQAGSKEYRLKGVETDKSVRIIKPLAFLCLFIVIITINSGLMYQVLNPAFAHHEWLVSWYWAVPYIGALFIMRNLPRKANRTYVLFVAIAMIGLSFISFMIFDRSALSYLFINTLMLGACGVYDLFWWSILGEMLDWSKNPAKILGIGLSANVFGVLLGGLIGSEIITMNTQDNYSSVVALVVVFAILIILPLLHKQLSIHLRNHVYLTQLSEMSPTVQTKVINSFTLISNLTDRESEIATLLMRGRTYKMIAAELYLSENTIKTHIKNIYSKLHIQNKAELIRMLMENEIATSK